MRATREQRAGSLSAIASYGYASSASSSRRHLRHRHSALAATLAATTVATTIDESTLNTGVETSNEVDSEDSEVDSASVKTSSEVNSEDAERFREIIESDGEEGSADNDIRSDENFEDDSDESLYELDSATTVVNAAPVVDAATSAPVVNVAIPPVPNRTAMHRTATSYPLRTRTWTMRHQRKIRTGLRTIRTTRMLRV